MNVFSTQLRMSTREGSDPANVFSMSTPYVCAPDFFPQTFFRLKVLIQQMSFQLKLLDNTLLVCFGVMLALGVPSPAQPAPSHKSPILHSFF